MRTFRAAVGVAMATLLLVLAPAAGADPNSVAQAWSPTQHVAVTAGSNPTLNNAGALNNQILATSLPIYVAVDNATPADLGKAFSQRLGHKFQGVIVAAGSHGIYAAAENTAGGSQAANIASSVAKQYGRNLDAGLNAFVTQFAQAAHSAAQPASSVGGAPHKSSYAWLWWLIGIVAAVAVIAVLVVVLSGSRRRKAERNEALAQQKRTVEKKLIRASSKVNDLSDWMNSSPVDVSTEYNKANVALGDAQTANTAGKFDAVETHLETVDVAYSRANKKVNPPPPHSPSEGVAMARSVPREDRKQATINAKTSSGQTVVINNNDYSTTQRSGYANQWPGGMYGGAYWAPGYYPYSFWGGGYSWGLTDMLIADAIIDDHWGGQYDYAPGYGSYDSNGSFTGGSDYGQSTADTNWQGDTSSDGGGDYNTGQDNTSSDGGADYGTSGGDDGTSNDGGGNTGDDGSSGSGWDSGGDDGGGQTYSAPSAPAYDGGGSGGGDYGGGGGSDFGGGGGGGDYGGGGGDFGGGGGDSGGGW